MTFALSTETLKVLETPYSYGRGKIMIQFKYFILTPQ